MMSENKTNINKKVKERSANMVKTECLPPVRISSMLDEDLQFAMICSNENRSEFVRNAVKDRIKLYVNNDTLRKEIQTLKHQLKKYA